MLPTPKFLQENPEVIESSDRWRSRDASPKSMPPAISLFGTNGLPVTVGCSQGMPRGLLTPFWSSGVFIAVLSGEKAADMLDRTLRQRQRRAAEFARYEQPRWPGHGSVLKVRDRVVYPRVCRPCSKS